MMSRRVLIAGVACLALVSGAIAQTNIGRAGAQFLRIDPSARGVALGGAYVAVTDGADAAHYNPAGLTGVGGVSILLSRVDYVADIEYNYAAVAFPALGGVLGLQFGAMSTDEMLVTTIDDPTNASGETFDVGSWVAGVSYGRAWTDKLSFGVTAKYVHESIWDMKSGVVAFDMGTIYDTGFNNWTIAASLSNFGPSTELAGGQLVSEYNKYDNPSQANVQAEDKSDPYNLPLTFRLATAYEFSLGESARLITAMSGAHPNDGPEFVTGGAELGVDVGDITLALRGRYRYVPEEAFGQRLGAAGTVGGLTAGSDERLSEDSLVLGAGLAFPLGGTQLGVDYAFQDFGRLGDNQRFSFSVSF